MKKTKIGTTRRYRGHSRAADGQERIVLILMIKPLDHWSLSMKQAILKSVVTSISVSTVNDGASSSSLCFNDIGGMQTCCVIMVVLHAEEIQEIRHLAITSAYYQEVALAVYNISKHMSFENVVDNGFTCFEY
ncbi:hypothetical protein PIB30_053677 [Stylosanthes scabra]|uniref:Uncharacterized protein n=1 Tax=Stylosanthes scabra TaxID=79078 RepID=A0ABU6TIC3_9FABA|nr:hypothetical protein [Stylosanthes scabra]